MRLCPDHMPTVGDRVPIGTPCPMCENQTLLAEVEKLKDRYQGKSPECHGGHQPNLPLALWDCPTCTDAVRKERDDAILRVAELESLARQSGMGYYDLITSEFPEIVAATPRIAVMALMKMAETALLQIGEAAKVLDIVRRWNDAHTSIEGEAWSGQLRDAIEAFDKVTPTQKPFEDRCICAPEGGIYLSGFKTSFGLPCRVHSAHALKRKHVTENHQQWEEEECRVEKAAEKPKEEPRLCNACGVEVKPGDAAHPYTHVGEKRTEGSLTLQVICDCGVPSCNKVSDHRK